MSNDERFCQFIDRILAVREEVDGRMEEVRRLYKDAKDEGFDKTAMGSLVAELRKSAKDPAKAEAASDTLDLYRDAYRRGRAHTGAHANMPDWSEVKAAANGGGH